MNEPELPRKRKCPLRFETGVAEAEFHTDCKSLYRQQYFEALDLVVTSIKNRFDQPGFRMYRNLEELLLHCFRGQPWETVFMEVTEFYREDLDPDRLRLHLQILSSTYPGNTENISVNDILKYLKGLSPGESLRISKVVLVMQLILVMPSTNAVSERSFSALRRLKTYLRATMKQSRLNHLLLHVHKADMDALTLESVADAFVGNNEHRMSMFGKFLSRA